MNLSKSKYTTGVICKKKLWLDCYKNDVGDSLNETVLKNGEEIGRLARGLFGNYTLIDYDLGFDKMLEETKRELLKKTKVICEASFSYDGNFCSVDILKNYEDGVEIYEVKSSTSISPINKDDISYQSYVLQKCGLNVKKCFIVHINDKYVLDKELDINKLFVIEDVTDEVDILKVEDNIGEFKKVINSSEEVDTDFSTSCHDPNDCPYFNYCTRNLVTPNVFDIGWSTKFSKKVEMFKRGHISFREVFEKESLNDKARLQVDSYLNNLDASINKEEIKEFLDNLEYPLYFLDFESYQDAIPRIQGTKPYQQICFQYSLHILDKIDGNIIHKEYLSDDYNGNPMQGLCKRLCDDIPLNSCVIVYNQTFEKARLGEMADLFLEYREHLLNIRDNIVDLFPIFKKQYYYVKEMGGSASIKYVLPALFPNDESLNYHNLSQVHKGDEASLAYLSLKDLTMDEETKLRDNLLKYCCLDTYAMVKIYEKLREVV